jgi:hypothetical protein
MDPEIIELDIGGKTSSNFGSGIELLMNDKFKNDSGGGRRGGGNDDITLNDLTMLENELNDISGELNSGSGSGSTKKISRNMKSDIFSINFSNDDDDGSGNAGGGGGEEPLSSAFNIGSATASGSGIGQDDKPTWDGYAKFNNIPMNPDVPVEGAAQPQMTKEELLREKFKLLRKLEELESKGITLTKKYTMESSILEMRGEYETHVEERERQNSKKFQSKMLLACITGLEFLNNKFDPFDLKLDGWSEQVNENIDEYDEIFAELHEKYKSKAQMAPELKLLFQLGGSAIMLHMTNTMFKSALPGMDDIMRQNPELMQQFTQAAVNSMSSSSQAQGLNGRGGGGGSGFTSFMSDIMGGGGSNSGSSLPSRPPPPPVATKSVNAAPPPPRPGAPIPIINRPDINLGRGQMNTGVSMSDIDDDNDDMFMGRLKSQTQGPASSSTSTSSRVPQGQGRPEMRGPSVDTDINSILSGLKTKSINIQQSQQSQPQQQQQESSGFSDIETGSAPLKSKRKPRSEKNTISLNI